MTPYISSYSKKRTLVGIKYCICWILTVRFILVQTSSIECLQTPIFFLFTCSWEFALRWGRRWRTHSRAVNTDLCGMLIDITDAEVECHIESSDESDLAWWSEAPANCTIHTQSHLNQRHAVDKNTIHSCYSGQHNARLLLRPAFCFLNEMIAT